MIEVDHAILSKWKVQPPSGHAQKNWQVTIPLQEYLQRNACH